MSVFTDEDLKRLKDNHARCNELSKRCVVCDLLARLECAEAFITQLQNDDDLTDDDMEKDKQLYDAWRKACGR